MDEMAGFPGGCGPNECGELASQVLVVDPDGIDGTTVRVWLALHAGTTHPLVMLEAEDRDSRNRRALLPDLARSMAEALATLHRLQTAALGPTAGHDHPGWCAQQEGAGAPHRSRELLASAPHDNDTVSVRLTHARHHPTPTPSTFIDIHTHGDTLAWPPLTPVQHHALIGKLTLLLDLVRLHEQPSVVVAGSGRSGATAPMR